MGLMPLSDRADRLLDMRGNVGFRQDWTPFFLPPIFGSLSTERTLGDEQFPGQPSLGQIAPNSLTIAATTTLRFRRPTDGLRRNLPHQFPNPSFRYPQGSVGRRPVDAPPRPARPFREARYPLRSGVQHRESVPGLIL